MGCGILWFINESHINLTKQLYIDNCLLVLQVPYSGIIAKLNYFIQEVQFGMVFLHLLARRNKRKFKRSTQTNNMLNMVHVICDEPNQKEALLVWRVTYFHDVGGGI